jgi:hypothetical protein
LAGVGAVANVHQVTELRRVDLLVLGRDQETGNTDQLQLGTRDLLELEVAINEVDRQVQSLRHELELQVDLNQPVDEDRTHTLVDVRLPLHVHWANRRRHFVLPEEDIHLRNVAGGAERILGVALINVVGVSRHLVRVGIGVDFPPRVAHGITVGSGGIAILMGMEATEGTSTLEHDFLGTIVTSNGHGTGLGTGLDAIVTFGDDNTLRRLSSVVATTISSCVCDIL